MSNKKHRQIQTTETSIYLCITTILKGQDHQFSLMLPYYKIKYFSILRTCWFPLVFVYLQLSSDKDGLSEDISKAIFHCHVMALR